jgi:hypothetical protein
MKKIKVLCIIFLLCGCSIYKNKTMNWQNGIGTYDRSVNILGDFGPLQIRFTNDGIVGGTRLLGLTAITAQGNSAVLPNPLPINLPNNAAIGALANSNGGVMITVENASDYFITVIPASSPTEGRVSLPPNATANLGVVTLGPSSATIFRIDYLLTNGNKFYGNQVPILN